VTKSDKKWQKVTSDNKWRKVSKSVKKCQKVSKSVKKWQKVTKSDKKWQKVTKSDSLAALTRRHSDRCFLHTNPQKFDFNRKRLNWASVRAGAKGPAGTSRRTTSANKKTIHIVAFSDEKILVSTGVVLDLPHLRVDLEPTAFSLHGFYGRSLPPAPDEVGMILNAQIPRERPSTLRGWNKGGKWFTLEKFIRLSCNPNLCLSTLFRTATTFRTPTAPVQNRRFLVLGDLFFRG